MENNETVLETPVLETPVIPAPAPPSEVEKVYSFQPTDKRGRPVGGMQVIKYKTDQELVEKITKNYNELQIALRDVTRKHRLGISEEESIPAEAARFENPVEFKPKDLSADERIVLSRDLLDPEKTQQANAKLFEANTGVSPEEFRKTMTGIQVTNLRMLAKQEADAFVAETPTYFKCQENFETITNWMVKNNLAPVRANFKLGYETLLSAGLLTEAPTVREEIPVPETVVETTTVNSQPSVDEPSRIASVEPPQVMRPAPEIASGLTRDEAADLGPTPRKSGYTQAEIDAMPSAVYKRKLLSEKGFAEAVETLETEKANRRNSNTLRPSYN